MSRGLASLCSWDQTQAGSLTQANALDLGVPELPILHQTSTQHWHPKPFSWQAYPAVACQSRNSSHPGIQRQQSWWHFTPVIGR